MTLYDDSAFEANSGNPPLAPPPAVRRELILEGTPLTSEAKAAREAGVLFYVPPAAGEPKAAACTMQHQRQC